MKLPAGCEHRFWSATASSVRSLICTGRYFGPIWFRWARVGALGRVLRPLVSEKRWLNPFGDEAPRNQVLFFDNSGCGKSCNFTMALLRRRAVGAGRCESLHEP